jgi:hypothetical protein
MFPPMSTSDQGDDEQRRDALLLRLLKTPPQPRAELAEQVRRAKAKGGYQRRTAKPKARPASKGRVHKGKTRR